MLKKILQVCGLSLLITSIVFNVIQRSNFNDLKTASDILEDKYSSSLRYIDSLDVINDSIILNYESKLDSLSRLNQKSNNRVAYLNLQLDNLSNAIDTLTGDEAYDKTKEEYGSVWDMPVSGTYTFNELEVKDIYKTSVRVKYLDSIRYEQRKVIDRMSEALGLKDDVIDILEDEDARKQRMLNQMNIDFMAIRRELELSQEKNDDLRKKLNLWKAGSISTGAILLSLLILL